MPDLLALQQAAADVIQILKRIEVYSNAKVAVIGGLALWTYLPEGRSTEVFYPKHSSRRGVTNVKGCRFHHKSYRGARWRQETAACASRLALHPESTNVLL